MTAFVRGPVSVSVPATSANLGPGFDALGLALALRDRVTAQVLAGPRSVITVRGVGEGRVPLDEDHLVHRSMQLAFDAMGCPPPALRLDCANLVPHARGLGSSSAAIVAGVWLARALVDTGDALLDDDAAFALAAELEGHPDNVAPAALGGFTVAYRDGDRFRAVRLPVDPRVHVVAFVPPVGVETTVARGLLPDTVPHRDAAHNAGRAALLVAALGGRLDLLLAATEDRLHQACRGPAMPVSLALVDALRAEGLAAVVSGAGPTVLVLTDSAGQAEVAQRVPSGWDALVVPIDLEGARVEAPGAARDDVPARRGECPD
jgi:homoserine kinase